MRCVHPLKKAYARLSLRGKLALIILVSFALPLGVAGIIVAGLLPDMITAKTLQDEQAATARTAPFIEEHLDQILLLSDVLSEDAFFKRLFLSNPEIQAAEMLNTPDADDFSLRCHQLLKEYGIQRISYYLELPDDSACFTDTDDASVFLPASRISGTYWHGIFSSTRLQALFCPPIYLGVNERRQAGDLAYIRRLYARNYAGPATVCYQVIYFHTENLQTILKEQLSREGSLSYISNEREALITSTDPALTGIYYMNYSDIRANLMSSNGFLEKNVLGETVYVSCCLLDNPGWFLVTVTPSAPLQAQTQSVLRMIALVWFIAVAIGLLIAFRLSRSISERIGAVSKQMSNVRTSPPMPMDPPAETDEIGTLTLSYNYMANRINELMDQQKQSAEELRAAEFQSLQAQINPHFLYNTMELINWTAQQGKLSETNAAITDLSRFYKLTLSRKKTTSTIRDEIEHITIYIRLQNMRFDNGINLVADVPDEMADIEIPKLTLQPLVENAILHGILEKKTHHGTIVLTGWIDETDAVLLLSDDGIGMDPARIPDILNGTGNASDSDHHHIAVYNIHRRIQILYGEAYGLTCQSESDNGTEITIRLPYRKKQDV